MIKIPVNHINASKHKKSLDLTEWYRQEQDHGDSSMEEKNATQISPNIRLSDTEI